MGLCVVESLGCCVGSANCTANAPVLLLQMPHLKDLTIHMIGYAHYAIIDEDLSQEFVPLKLLPKLRSAKFSSTYLSDTVETNAQ